jgi:hypothetical protein
LNFFANPGRYLPQARPAITSDWDLDRGWA